MLKKTMTYTDFNGETRTEDLYFNLTQAEVAELELSTKGGLAESLKTMVAAEDGATIVATLKKIILMAYGVKSPDGREFVKNEELRNKFASTNAYSDLFMALATDEAEATKFMNGVVPQAPVQAGQPQDHKPKTVIASDPRPPGLSTITDDPEYRAYLEAKKATPES